MPVTELEMLLEVSPLWQAPAPSGRDALPVLQVKHCIFWAVSTRPTSQMGLAARDGGAGDGDHCHGKTQAGSLLGMMQPSSSFYRPELGYLMQ